MNKPLKCLSLLGVGLYLILLSVACSKPATNTTSNTSNATNTNGNAANKSVQDYTVVINVPTGTAGVSYANVDVDELEPWGPSALRIAPDGTFLIVNTAANNILRFRSDGNQLRTIKVDNVVGITDVAADEANLYVLDDSSVQPSILKLSNEGEMLDRRSLLPTLLERGLSGLTMGDDGQVLLEFGGVSVARGIDNKPGRARALAGKPFSVNVPALQQQASEGALATVNLDNKRFAEIKVENLVAGLEILATGSEGDVFVLVDEIAATPQVNIDETVRHYRGDGTLIELARVPVRELYSHVAHNVAIDRSGQVFAAITKKEGFQIVRLQFQPKLEPILSKSPFNTSAPALEVCNRARADMLKTAAAYRDNKSTLSKQNLDGACGGRTKPRYLGATPGLSPSVAYDWGGADSLKLYLEKLAQNRTAGDINTKGVEECSTGVDCSGFVTRCWGFKDGTKYGTATLPNISVEITILQLTLGDILNYPKKHVVMFDRFADDPSGKGIMNWESTTTNGVDRVVFRRSNWTRLQGYVARRYKKVCP
ncbi:MAG TPA: hypothetical protein VJT71_06140 [Pyrinomonadaceae bacterium]|nr:hypothetical protein [Pyrinomonadaceae bacterium]